MVKCSYEHFTIMLPHEQLYLNGFENLVPPPTGSHPRQPNGFGPRSSTNLFFGILPDEKAGPQIDELAQTSCATHGLSGKILGIPRFHISLHSLGAPLAPLAFLIPKLSEIFAPLVAAISAFEVRFDRALTFKTKSEEQPFVLRNSQHNHFLLNLYRVFGTVLNRPAKTFTPHVILLYDRREVGEHPIAPVSWVAKELVLVHSLVGQGIHEHVARFPFRLP